MLCYRKKSRHCQGSYGEKISLSHLFTYNVKQKRRSGVRDIWVISYISLKKIFYSLWFQIILVSILFLYLNKFIKHQKTFSFSWKNAVWKGEKKNPAETSSTLPPLNSQSYCVFRLLCINSCLHSKLGELRSWTLPLIILNVRREFCYFQLCFFKTTCLLEVKHKVWVKLSDMKKLSRFRVRETKFIDR